MTATQAVDQAWQASPYASPAKRIRWVLFTAMSLASASAIAMATVNSIVGADLGGSPAWAGVPSATILVGSALASPLWGVLSDRLGRRGSLAAGMALGVLGAALAGAGVVRESLAWFLIGLGLTGFASAAVQLSRFAAGEVHPPALRAQAISTVVLGGAVGSIAGPVLVAPSGAVAASRGMNELVGPFGASMLLSGAASLVVAWRLRPEPRRLGAEVAAAFAGETIGDRVVRPLAEILGGRAARLAVAAMALGQMVMVMVMVITSLHMRRHDHALSSISFVIASHTLGMFATSLISGRLADRWGRVPVIALGAAILALASLAASLSPDVLPMSLALFSLGLGWNLCYVGGSALLADQLRPAERARTQGVNDLLVGAASAVGSLGSGVVFAAVGFSTMAFFGAAVSLIPLTMALAARRPAPALEGV